MPLLLLAFIAASGAVSAQSVHSLAIHIGNGTGTERRRAVSKVRQLPTSERTPELQRALTLELDRLNEESEEIGQASREHRRARLAPNRRLADGATGDIDHEYFTDVLALVIESHSAQGLHAVVGAIGYGAGIPAEEEIARFGERAVPLLVRQAARVRRSGDDISVMFTIQRLLARNPGLSSRSRQALAGEVRPLLRGPQRVAVFETAIEAAGALNVDSLTEILNTIAKDGPEAAGLEVSGGRGQLPDFRKRLMAAAQKALARGQTPLLSAVGLGGFSHCRPAVAAAGSGGGSPCVIRQ